MFDILDFIDSKDIREYNKDTRFTLIEQAYLLCYSRKTTIEAKLAAWHELYDIYTEEDFEQTHFGKMQLDKKSNRQVLADTIAICENALALRTPNNNYVYEAVYYNNDDPRHAMRRHFSTFSNAVEHLREKHQAYLEEWESQYKYYFREDEFQRGSAVAKITVRPWAEHGWYETVFYFDENMRLTTIDPVYAENPNGWCNVAYRFIYVPLPFKKGDIVRLRRLTDTQYGVLSCTPDEAYYREYLNEELKSNSRPPERLDITLDTYDPDDGQLGTFDRYGYNPLEFELCADDELPEDQRNLTLLREVYRDELPVGELMVRYCRLGKEAYCCY